MRWRCCSGPVTVGARTAAAPPARAVVRAAASVRVEQAAQAARRRHGRYGWQLRACRHGRHGRLGWSGRHHGRGGHGRSCRRRHGRRCGGQRRGGHGRRRRRPWRRGGAAGGRGGTGGGAAGGRGGTGGGAVGGGNGSWQLLAPMPSGARQEHCVAALGGLVYAIGSYNGNAEQPAPRGLRSGDEHLVDQGDDAVRWRSLQRRGDRDQAVRSRRDRHHPERGVRPGRQQLDDEAADPDPARRRGDRGDRRQDLRGGRDVDHGEERHRARVRRVRRRHRHLGDPARLAGHPAQPRPGGRGRRHLLRAGRPFGAAQQSHGRACSIASTRTIRPPGRGARRRRCRAPAVGRRRV